MCAVFAGHTVAALQFAALSTGHKSCRCLETGSLHPPLAALRLFPLRDLNQPARAGYGARTRFPASHEWLIAIRGNPASPLILYALRAWVESGASAACGGESALLSRMRRDLRLPAEAGNRNGATVFGSEFSPSNEKTGHPNRMSCFNWSGLRGSNSLPPPWQGGALPDELSPRNRIYFSRCLALCQVFSFVFFIFLFQASPVPPPEVFPPPPPSHLPRSPESPPQASPAGPARIPAGPPAPGRDSNSPPT